jgi:hypothetical protein
VLSNLGLKAKKQSMGNAIHHEPLWMLARSTGPFIKIAAVSGALAVILGAYNGHSM